MRHIIAMGSIGTMCVVLGLGFVLSRRSKAALEPGILFSQVGQLVTGWEAQNTPESDRVVNIVVDDAGIGGLVKKLSSSYSNESIYEAEELPYSSGGFTGWFKRTFFRGSMSVETPGPLAQSFSNKFHTITWTHKGTETASEEEMAQEFMKAILAAHDAGAEVNIVTRGRGAAAALKAIKRLEGVTRKSRPVAVRKLLALDMNTPTLKKLDPAFFYKFNRPVNLGEYASVWQSPTTPYTRKIAIDDRNHNGTWFAAEKLFPTIGLQKSAPLMPIPEKVDADVLKFTGILLNRQNTLGKVVDYMVKTAKAQEESRRSVNVVARDLKGRAYNRQIDVGGGHSQDADKDASKTHSESAIQTVKDVNVVARDLKGRAYNKTIAGKDSNKGVTQQQAQQNKTRPQAIRQPIPRLKPSRWINDTQKPTSGSKSKGIGQRATSIGDYKGGNGLTQPSSPIP